MADRIPYRYKWSSNGTFACSTHPWILSIIPARSDMPHTIDRSYPSRSNRFGNRSSTRICRWFDRERGWTYWTRHLSCILCRGKRTWVEEDHRESKPACVAWHNSWSSWIEKPHIWSYSRSIERIGSCRSPYKIDATGRFYCRRSCTYVSEWQIDRSSWIWDSWK